MKVFKKKNLQLNMIGEGTLISKKNIVLKEADEVTANKTQALPSGTPSQTVSNAKKALNTNGGNLASISASDADGAKDGEGEGQSLNVDVNDPQATDKVNRFTQDGHNGNSKVNFYDSKKGQMKNVYVPNGATTNVTLQNNSYKRSGKLIEMRKNSIPFTKKELGKFLKLL